MRIGWALCIVMFGANLARADSHWWRVSSDRVAVWVATFGFDEGAGESGWDEADAHQMAIWVLRMEAVVPAGWQVNVTREEDDTTLELATPARKESVTMPGGPDLEGILARVARRFGKRVPRAGRAMKLFTLEVSTSRSEAETNAVAARLDDREVSPTETFYDAACAPCRVPVAHVLVRGDGQYRVVLGVYYREADARKALARLTKEYGVDAHVAEL